MTAQTAQLQALIDGVYTNVPLYADPVTIKRGLSAAFSGSSWPSPSEFTATINNDDLAYDPSRPASLLYGKVGRNTRVRIRPAGSTRIYAEAATWEPVRTPDHVPGARKGKSSTGIRAAGVLERLSRWTEPLRSPMYRTAAGRPTSIGHWSLEDDASAVQLANSLPGGYPASLRGVELAQDDRPFGARQTVRVASGSLMAGRWSPASTTAGWQVFFSFRLAAVPPSATYGRLLRWQTSNLYTWTVDVNNAGYLFTVTDSSGVIKWQTATGGFGTGVEPNKWVTFRMRVAQSGGNVDVQPAWYAQGMDSPFGISDLFAGSIGAPRVWYQDGDAINDGGFFSHIGAVTTVADDLDGSDAIRVFNAYLGETAIARYLRVMAEAGITRYRIGTTSRSMPMGPQPIDQLITVIKECRDTEDGDISDERFDIATTMRERVDSYDMTPALELTHSSGPGDPGDVAAFKKLVGTEGAWNYVTVKNRDGGDWTVSLASGAMSTQAPPDGIGEIKRQVDVNVDDERRWLPMIASWHLAKGTLEGPRYTEITVDLVRHPELVTDATDVREGDLITVDGLEPDLLRLLVVGIEERLTSGTWRVTFLCEPYNTYMAGTWDDDSFIWGTDLSSLDVGVDETETDLVVVAEDARGVWTSGMVGESFIIAGERVEVVSVGAADSLLKQDIVVVRSVNGVVKALAAGDKVELFDNRRWGL